MTASAWVVGMVARCGVQGKGERMIGVLFGRHLDGVVRTERIKLVAGGTQLIAIGILVGSSISPFLNAGLQVSFWARLGAAGVAGVLELGALHILGYLATAVSTEG